MPRPIKVRQVRGNRTHWLDGRQALGADPIPHSSAVLHDLVAALLFRIRESDPDLQRQLSVMIGEVALTEWMLENKPFLFERKEARDRAVQRIKAAVDMVAVGVKARASHLENAVAIQWDLLADILKHEPFPLKRNNDALVNLWLKNMGAGLAQTLSLLPCYCAYRPDCFTTLSDHSLLNLKACRSTAEAMTLLLAEFHATTTAQIEKLRKPSQVLRSSHRS